MDSKETNALARRFQEEVGKASSVLVGSHLNPDGDALGSALAVGHYLDGLGIANEVLCHHKAPANLQFLPGAHQIRQTPKRASHDLAIVVDLDSLDRLGSTAPYFEKCPQLILLDHHLPHRSPGDLRIVDPSAPATSLILTRLLLACDADITADMATCLLTGIVTDTGSFRFRNTTPESLSLSAVLLERGGDINLVSEQIYQSTPIAAARLMGILYERMRFTSHDRLCWCELGHDDFVKTGATDADTEGLANDLLSIETVQIAALFRESRPGKVRTSLRSRHAFDVAEVAREFGGGGHANAAGCTFEEPIHQAAERVVARLKICLESS